MPTLQQQIEQRANVWEQYQEVLARADKPEGWTAEDRQSMDRMDAEVRTLTEDIERRERAARLEGKFSEPTGGHGGAPDGSERSGGGQPTDEAYEAAFWAVMRSGISGVSAEQRQLAEQRFIPGEELRAQGISTDAAGGFLVPEGFWNRLSETMKAFGGVLGVANVINTDTGNNLPWPTNDDTGNEGEYLAENTGAGEQDTTFGQRTLGAHMCSSKIVRVSFQLLQDSAFSLDAFVPRKQGERIGRRSNRAFTTGTGTNEPEGVQTNATVGKTGAGGQTTTVTYDDLIDLEHSVDPAYRNERTRWMFHDLTLAALRKVTDNDGRPLWQPSVIAGQASTLNGRPYVVNNDMPVMAADAKSILFGDFNAGYVVRRVRAFQALRLTERYADFLQVGFLGFDRHDGKPDDPAAIRAYQNAAA